MKMLDIRFWIFGMLLILTASASASASQCHVGGDCFIYHDVTDNTTYDNVTLDVYYSSNMSIIYDDVTMQLQEDDLYFYIARFSEQGNYTAFISVLNNSIEQYNTTYSFIVTGSNSLRVGVCPNTTAGVMVLFLIVLLGLFFLVYGFNGSQISGIFGSLIFLVSSWFIYGCSSILGFIIGCLGVVLLGGFSLGVKN